MTRLLRILSGLLLAALAAATFVLVLPLLRGEPSRIVIVSGHSMDPTFHTGDLVLAWPSDDYRIGDVAPYRVPDGQPGEGGLVIHRIVGGDGDQGFVMQGDNNPAPDVWMPRHDDVIGRKVLLVPRVGELLAWARQPVVLAALVAGLVTAVAVSSALDRDRREADDGTERTADDFAADDSAADDRDAVIDLREPATAPDRVPAGGPATPAVPAGSSEPSGRTPSSSRPTVAAHPAPGSD